MSEVNFVLLNYFWIALAIIILLILLFTGIRAPYGRHTNPSWGPCIPNRFGWILMELPALVTFPLLFFSGNRTPDLISWLLLSLWILHYSNRTLLFPLRLRTKGKQIPLGIVLSGMFFNLVNGFLNGYWLGYLAPPYDSTLTFNVMIGLFIFFVGFVINQMSDTKLIALRKERSGYQIPKGWLFDFISCPNHFGEIVEWAGFAMIAWNLPALTFAIWTACNLLPRALNHHAWYRENFEHYPSKRKAIIPGIW